MLSKEKILSFTFAAIVAFIVTFSMKMLFLNEYQKDVNDENYKRELAGSPGTTQIVKLVKEPTVKVLVAKRTLRRGESLSIEVLDWKDWPKSLISKNYIATENGKPLNETFSADSIMGLRAVHQIDQGVPITESMFFKKEQVVESDKDIKIRAGMRAFTVPVNPSSVSHQMFFPGDIVDIYVPTIKTFFRNVKILALDNKTSVEEIETAIESAIAAAGGDTSKKGKTRYTPKTATIELTPVQLGKVVPNVPPAGVTLILISDKERSEYMQKYADEYVEQNQKQPDYSAEPSQVEMYTAKGVSEHIEVSGKIIKSPEDPDQEKIPNTNPKAKNLEDDKHYTVTVVKRDAATEVIVPKVGELPARLDHPGKKKR